MTGPQSDVVYRQNSAKFSLGNGELCTDIPTVGQLYAGMEDSDGSDPSHSPTAKEPGAGGGSVRRPMNAFLIFCKRHRSLVREKNPHLDNRSVTRILGELWANLSPDEKSSYINLAKQYKEAFLKANPDYKWYNPDKHAAAQAASNSGATSPGAKSGTKPSNVYAVYQKTADGKDCITPGKLADPSDMGGLSLLLMADKATCSTSPPAEGKGVSLVAMASASTQQQLPNGKALDSSVVVSGTGTVATQGEGHRAQGQGQEATSSKSSSTDEKMAKKNALLQLAEMCTTHVYNAWPPQVKMAAPSQAGSAPAKPDDASLATGNVVVVDMAMPPGSFPVTPPWSPPSSATTTAQGASSKMADVHNSAAKREDYGRPLDLSLATTVSAPSARQTANATDASVYDFNGAAGSVQSARDRGWVAPSKYTELKVPQVARSGEVRGQLSARSEVKGQGSAPAPAVPRVPHHPAMLFPTNTLTFSAPTTSANQMPPPPPEKKLRSPKGSGNASAPKQRKSRLEKQLEKEKLASSSISHQVVEKVIESVYQKDIFSRDLGTRPTKAAMGVAGSQDQTARQPADSADTLEGALGVPSGGMMSPPHEMHPSTSPRGVMGAASPRRLPQLAGVGVEQDARVTPSSSSSSSMQSLQHSPRLPFHQPATTLLQDRASSVQWSHELSPLPGQPPCLVAPPQTMPTSSQQQQQQQQQQHPSIFHQKHEAMSQEEAAGSQHQEVTSLKSAVQSSPVQDGGSVQSIISKSIQDAFITAAPAAPLSSPFTVGQIHEQLIRRAMQQDPCGPPGSGSWRPSPALGPQNTAAGSTDVGQQSVPVKQEAETGIQQQMQMQMQQRWQEQQLQPQQQWQHQQQQLQQQQQWQQQQQQQLVKDEVMQPYTFAPSSSSPSSSSASESSPSSSSTLSSSSAAAAAATTTTTMEAKMDIKSETFSTGACGGASSDRTRVSFKDELERSSSRSTEGGRLGSDPHIPSANGESSGGGGGGGAPHHGESSSTPSFIRDSEHLTEILERNSLSWPSDRDAPTDSLQNGLPPTKKRKKSEKRKKKAILQSDNTSAVPVAAATVNFAPSEDSSAAVVCKEAVAMETSSVAPALEAGKKKGKRKKKLAEQQTDDGEPVKSKRKKKQSASIGAGDVVGASLTNAPNPTSAVSEPRQHQPTVNAVNEIGQEVSQTPAPKPPKAKRKAKKKKEDTLKRTDAQLFFECQDDGVDKKVGVSLDAQVDSNSALLAHRPEHADANSVLETKASATVKKEEEDLELAAAAGMMEEEVGDAEEAGGLRKSKRSNRGQRYKELLSQGVLQPARRKLDSSDDNHHGGDRPDGEYTPAVLKKGMRNRTVSESNKDDKDKDGAMKRYKTGDFDLEAHIASLPACHIDGPGKKAVKVKGRVRHGSGARTSLSSSSVAFAGSEERQRNEKHPDNPLQEMNIAELKHLTNTKKPSQSQVISQGPLVGSQRRKARKCSITRLLQAPHGADPLAEKPEINENNFPKSAGEDAVSYKSSHQEAGSGHQMEPQLIPRPSFTACVNLAALADIAETHKIGSQESLASQTSKPLRVSCT